VSHPGPAIAVEHLTKRYGSITAVDDLSFEVRRGAITGFLGPNGAGKTTTLRMVLGLARATSGSATVLGQPYAELDQPARRVGAALEVSSFHPGRSGRSHLRSLAAMADLPRSRVEEVLALVELTDAADRRAGKYSMGMRQRLALAATLLGDPEILVLDEPANGLDPQGVRWLRDVLRGRTAEGHTVLISSHVLAEIAQTVDDVVVISRGRLLHQGKIGDFTGRQTGLVRVQSPHNDRLSEVLAGAGGHVRNDDSDGTLLVEGLTRERIGDLALEATLAVYWLTEQTASLEEVFLELTGEQSNPGAPA